MTIEERFESIERGLANLVTLQESNQKALGSLIQSIDGFVDSSDARMTRLEANLDALIRAIMAEHTNGKPK